MLSFLADENFNNDIVRGVRRRNPGIVILRAQDVGLSGAADPVVLEWSAENAVAVLTHDVATMTKSLTTASQPARECWGYLKLAALSRLELRSNTSSLSLRAALPASGKAGSSTYR